MSAQTALREGGALPVTYLFPQSVEEAVQALADGQGQARIVAGGTDILPDLRAGKVGACVFVDITRIPGLDRIRVVDGWVEAGAAVTFAALKDSSFINQRVPALAEAAGCVGALAIQNAATWAGNLVQAMPAADGAIAALALDAEARLVSHAGAAWQPVESLFRGPGQSAVDPTRQMLTHIRFPIPDGPWGTAWGRVGRRASLVLPILNCAVSLVLDAGGRQIAQACVALGPVAPRPFRARQAEAYLVGQPPAGESFARAAQIAQEEAQPRDSILRVSRDYRLAIVPPVVEAALETAATRAAASGSRGIYKGRDVC